MSPRLQRCLVLYWRQFAEGMPTCTSPEAEAWSRSSCLWRVHLTCCLGWISSNSQYLGTPFAGEQNILGLNILVNESAMMHVLDAPGYVQSNLTAPDAARICCEQDVLDLSLTIAGACTAHVAKHVLRSPHVLHPCNLHMCHGTVHLHTSSSACMILAQICQTHMHVQQLLRLQLAKP